MSPRWRRRNILCMIIFFSVALRPNAGHGLVILEVSRSHTQRRITICRSPLDAWSVLSQRPLPDNTHHSQQTDFHVPGGIRTHTFSRRPAVDLRLRPRGHWDRLCMIITVLLFSVGNTTSANIPVVLASAIVCRNPSPIFLWLLAKWTFRLVHWRRVPKGPVASRVGFKGKIVVEYWYKWMSAPMIDWNNTNKSEFT